MNLPIILFNTCPKYETLFEIDENGREINIYKLNNCRPTGINLFYPNVLFNVTTSEQLILPLLERTMSLQTAGTIYEKNDMHFTFEPNNINNSVYTEPVFFFIYNTDNYFHFLYDSMPYLISFLHLKKTISTIKLLMQYPNEQKYNFYPFVLEFLTIFNIRSEDIIIIDAKTHYETVYISTSYTHDIDSNLPPRKEIYEFYQQMAQNVQEQQHQDISGKPYTIPKKIYISRRTHLHNDFSNIGTNYTTRRRLINEDELVASLQNKGYIEIFTEKLTTIEKITYFANATHIVGAIGGGISNVLFSKSTTKLEALISPTFLDVNARFKYSLCNVDVNYNMQTEHIEQGEFKTYMRVKTRDGKIVGEIEKIYDDKLLISYTLGSTNTGWNAQNTYQHIELNKRDVIPLDKGLNSPWHLLSYL